MPIYEYDCEECGARFEKLLFLTPHPVKVSCPKCGKDRVTKRLSLIASTPGSSVDGATSAAACTTST